MYTTKSGDTWDVIAKEVYGSEYRADVLMAANPQRSTRLSSTPGWS